MSLQSLLRHQRTDRLADQLADAAVQRLPDDAADVVGAEDALVDQHRAAPPAGFSRGRPGPGAGIGAAPGRGFHRLRERRRFDGIVVCASRLRAARGTPGEERRQCQQQRRDEARDRAEAERRRAGIRQAGRDAPRTAGHRRREHFRAAASALSPRSTTLKPPWRSAM
jgi:hypothetical protein